MNIQDKDFYGLVAQEMSNNIIDTGLMTKALAETEFDENRSKAMYIKMRVADLKNQQEQQQILLEKQILEAQKQKEYEQKEYEQKLKKQLEYEKKLVNIENQKLNEKKLLIFLLILMGVPLTIWIIFLIKQQKFVFLN